MNRRPVRPARRLPGAALLLFCSLQAACVAGRLTLEELPEQPIAFVHWADKAGQKRGEIFASAAEIPPLPPDEDDPEGLQELQIRAHLRGDETLVLRTKLAKYPGRLMLLFPRTGEIERIDAAPLDSLPLAWSPDRDRLLIASAHRGGKEQLYEYDLSRKVLSPVTFGPFEHSRGAYDARGRIVVHRSQRVSDRGASRQTIHRLQAGTRMSPALAESVPPGPLQVLPEGDRIVYEQIRPRPRRNGPTVFESLIAIRELAPGAEEDRLIKGREPTLTPDGQWIVFASESTAGYRLRRMRLDGTSRVAIGPGGAEERMPSVSPDGEFIVFVQFSGGRRRLVARRYDGKDERVLLPSGWSEFPVW